MDMVVAGAMDGARSTPNRFDALRLAFAGLVAVYHVIALAALSAPVEGVFAALAELSIQGFFIVSGALVFGSFRRSRDMADYAGKRVRRLYPAYGAVVLVSGLAALLVSGAWAEVGRYLAANLVFLNYLAPDVSGVFEANRFSAINGALWTIKIEVMFYLIVPALAFVIGKLASRGTAIFLAAIYIAAELWRIGFEASGIVDGAAFARQLPGQMSFFASGIAMALCRDAFGTGPNVMRRALVLSVLLPLSFVPGLEPVRAVGLAAAIAVAAFAPGPALAAARFGDVSYGLYLAHFPIIQMVIALGVFGVSVPLGLFAATVLTLAASFALWRFIEKPALRQTSHYRRADIGLAGVDSGLDPDIQTGDKGDR